MPSCTRSKVSVILKDRFILVHVLQVCEIQHSLVASRRMLSILSASLIYGTKK